MGFALMMAGMLGGQMTEEKENVQRPELLEELLRREKIDQDARTELVRLMKPGQAKGQPKDGNVTEKFKALAERLKKIDAENREWLKSIVDRHGWPGKSMVGEQGARIAWLLVQHADAEPAFQQRCLELMKKMPPDEIDRSHLAYLTDRVRVNTGKKQLFGTQLEMIDGKLTPKPIEDPEEVDKRRAQYGLPSLDDYLKRSEEMFKNPPPSKK